MELQDSSHQLGKTRCSSPRHSGQGTASHHKTCNRPQFGSQSAVGSHVCVANESDTSSAGSTCPSNHEPCNRPQVGNQSAVSPRMCVASESDADYAGSGSSGGSVNSGRDDGTVRTDLCDVVNGSDDSSSPRDFLPVAEFYVDVKTLQAATSNLLHSPRVLNSLVWTTAQCSDFSALLEELRKNHKAEKRADLRKVTMKTVLPGLAEGERFKDLASFLSLGEHHVQSSAVSWLESMLLDLRNSQDMSVTDQLLEVARSSKTALMQLSDNNPNLLPMTCLHLMAVSALLSRCPHPSQDQWSALAVSKKQGKKNKGEGLKQTMLKAVQVFHEGLEGVLDNEASSFQEWRQAGFSEEERSKRKADFGRASFCELVVNVFTLLNELKNRGWSRLAPKLLMTLRDGYESSSRPGRSKLSCESKAAMDFFLVHGMVLLLQSTFQEDELEFGELNNGHIQLITDLTVDVIKGANSLVERGLLREVEVLPFHNATYVKQAFNMLFRTKEKKLSQLAQGYMENRLQLVGFHRDRTSSGDQSMEDCAWQSFTCTVGQNPAEGFMYVPKASCLAGTQLDKCLEKHPGCNEKCRESSEKIAERAQRHIRDMDTKKALSPQCRYLLQMYSYQLLPFPFYVTEEVQQRRLLSYVLDHRNSQLWLDTSALVRVMTDVLEALMFLASRNIDPRDVTAYNMVVQAGVGNHRQSFGTRCSVLTGGDFVVKLADLGLSHEFLSNDAMYNDIEIIRPVRDQGAVPVRWTSPEALFEGLYSEKNMVYSAGCVMYELWTHGCQPFTSYDQTMDTGDILRMMLMQPGSMQLNRWPCIPRDVHDLIRHCTEHDPSKRPSLREVKETLCKLSQSERQDAQEPGLECALSMASKRYPRISEGQAKRRHVPETGVPFFLQRLIDAGKNSDLYNNTRRSMWKPSAQTVVNELELTTLDTMLVNNHGERTKVEEVVSPKFVREELPSLEVCDLDGVTCWSRTEEGSPRLDQQDGMFVHKREYCAKAVSLQTASLKGVLWDEDNASDSYEDVPSGLGFLVPFVSLARAVHVMHEKDWIIRDLKADTIFIDCNNGEVILPRIGRMRRLASQENYCFDDVFEDNRRWLAPEVLVSGEYGKENDIFMLGTAIWQTFRISELAGRDPLASRRDFAPCANIEKQQVVDYVREGTPLPFPARCPDWLYKLTIECRNPDPGKRPSAQQVLSTLQQHCTQGLIQTPFIVMDTSCDADDALDTDATALKEPAPPVKMRQKKRERHRSLKVKQSSDFFRSVRRRLTRMRTAARTRNATARKNAVRELSPSRDEAAGEAVADGSPASLANGGSEDIDRGHCSPCRVKILSPATDVDAEPPTVASGQMDGSSLRLEVRNTPAGASSTVTSSRAKTASDTASALATTRTTRTQPQNSYLGSTGEHNHLGSTGEHNHLGSTGEHNHLGGTGEHNHLGSTGEHNHLGSTGEHNHLGSTGEHNHLGSTGEHNHLGSTGEQTRKQTRTSSRLLVHQERNKAEEKSVGCVPKPPDRETTEVKQIIPTGYQSRSSPDRSSRTRGEVRHVGDRLGSAVDGEFRNSTPQQQMLVESVAEAEGGCAGVRTNAQVVDADVHRDNIYEHPTAPLADHIYDHTIAPVAAATPAAAAITTTTTTTTTTTATTTTTTTTNRPECSLEFHSAAGRRQLSHFPLLWHSPSRRVLSPGRRGISDDSYYTQLPNGRIWQHSCFLSEFPFSASDGDYIELESEASSDSSHEHGDMLKQTLTTANQSEVEPVLPEQQLLVRGFHYQREGPCDQNGGYCDASSDSHALMNISHADDDNVEEDMYAEIGGFSDTSSVSWGSTFDGDEEMDARAIRRSHAFFEEPNNDNFILQAGSSACHLPRLLSRGEQTDEVTGCKTGVFSVEQAGQTDDIMKGEAGGFSLGQNAELNNDTGNSVLNFLGVCDTYRYNVMTDSSV